MSTRLSNVLSLSVSNKGTFNNKGTVNINNKGTDHLILKNLLYTL